MHAELLKQTADIMEVEKQIRAALKERHEHTHNIISSLLRGLAKRQDIVAANYLVDKLQLPEKLEIYPIPESLTPPRLME